MKNFNTFFKGITYLLCLFSLTLYAQTPMPGESCDTAEFIECGNTLSGSTTGYSSNALSSCGTSLNTAPGRFYVLEGTGDNITVSTCDSANFDTKLGVFTTDDCSSLTCVAGNDDGSGCSGFTSEVSFNSNAGTLYYIYVTGFLTNSGDYELSITCETPLPGGSCNTAEFIECGDTVSDTTTGYTSNALSFCGTSLNTAPGRFYLLEGDGSSVTASLCDSSYDTKIGIFEGDCNALACVAGNDDNCGLQSSVTFATTSGNLYYIYVTGFSSSNGDFTLEISCANAKAASIKVVNTPEWNLYPNPSTNGEVELNLANYLNQEVSIQMTDFSGKVLLNNNELNLQTPKYRLSTQGMPYGMYFVRIVTESGVSTKKLLIANK